MTEGGTWKERNKYRKHKKEINTYRKSKKESLCGKSYRFKYII